VGSRRIYGIVLGEAADGMLADSAHWDLGARSSEGLAGPAVDAAYDLSDPGRAAPGRRGDVLRPSRRGRVDRTRERDRRCAVVDVNRLAEARRDACRIARAERQRDGALAVPSRVDRLTDRRRGALMPGRDVLPGRRRVDQLAIEARGEGAQARRRVARRDERPRAPGPTRRLPETARRVEGWTAGLLDIEGEGLDVELRGGGAGVLPAHQLHAEVARRRCERKPDRARRLVIGLGATSGPVEATPIIRTIVHAGRDDLAGGCADEPEPR